MIPISTLTQPKKHCANVLAQNRLLKISSDGYIRMTLTGLTALRFAHLVSDSDPNLLKELLVQALPVRIVGFSEWKSDSFPEVSLGWDWLLPIHSNQFFIGPDAIRSNLMLIDTHGYDLGAPTTSNLLRVWLNTVLDWQKTVRGAIGYPLDPSCQL